MLTLKGAASGVSLGKSIVVQRAQIPWKAVELVRVLVAVSGKVHSACKSLERDLRQPLSMISSRRFVELSRLDSVPHRV